ncbi:MAG: helix-turn-helix transcriptional regulator [Ignavibacteriales bacterium]|nr:helix-turn-helix transcriptional regulator [Ignavibacteriales bacterium]
MDIGERIRQFIDSQGMTSREFAKKIDMSYENLHAYLTNKRDPGAIVLSRLIEAGADVNWILTGTKFNANKELEQKVLSWEKLSQKYNILNHQQLENILRNSASIKKNYRELTLILLGHLTRFYGTIYLQTKLIYVRLSCNKLNASSTAIFV